MAQEALFYEFKLDRHVPADHLLRSIDQFVDLSDMREHLRGFYSTIGRPSIDPERHFKGIGSVDKRLLISAFDALAQKFEATIDQMHEDEAEMDEAIAGAVERDPW